jgi:hypothetical protein
MYNLVLTGGVTLRGWPPLAQVAGEEVVCQVFKWSARYKGELFLGL